MTKRIIFGLVLLCMIASLSLSSFAATPYENIDSNSKTNNSVINTANDNKNDNVRNARFLNMLNHNYLYDDAFNYEEDIVNTSVVALLDLRDTTNPYYINQKYVSDYIFNMYGISITDFSQFNKDFPYKDGFVYIIPRGFSRYNHKIESVIENEDGSFTVITAVTISQHDSDDVKSFAKTLFVKNDKSDFGFSIISSDLYDNGFKI